MAVSEENRTSPGPERLDLAVRSATEAVALLEPLTHKNAPETRRLLAQAWKLCGLAEEERQTAQGRQAAVRAYDEARKVFLTTLDSQNPQDQHELGSIWTHRGMTLLGSSERADLREAADCFAQAIALRSALPLETNWLFGWGLAASLMNRADALTRLGSVDELAEAVRCYDQALAHLAGLPADANMAAVRQREMVAWLNRGITLQAQKSAASIRAALESFDAAIALLHQHGLDHQPAYRRTLASALVNRSHALLDGQPCEALAARAAVLEALSLLAGSEDDDLLAAEAGLKARHSLCRALSWLLESPSLEGPAAAEDCIHEMTDAVDEALEIARGWEAQGEARFRPIASSLFRLGSRVFATWQPHFLAEFLLDHLDPERSAHAPADDRDMHAAAQEALLQATQVIQQRSRTWRAGADSAKGAAWLDQELRTLEELQHAESRLAELREQHLTTMR